ncbi:MAG TPA: LytR C-terminal domain-containing protein [Acidimicrobiia bacterium]|nr:LytR C-terminal domain-containing protein [Acidimicrobiia bacterium]
MARSILTSRRGSERGSAAPAAARGALLIGLAVLIGVFLLQQVDTNSAGAPAASSTKPKTTTTHKKTTTTTTQHGTTTTVASAPLKTPAQLRIIVLNGGAASGSAGTLSTALKTAGYTDQPDPASDWSGHQQTGKSILCKSGLDREAVALSQVSALSGATVGTFPTVLPTGVSSQVDCIVVVGSGG